MCEELELHFEAAGHLRAAHGIIDATAISDAADGLMQKLEGKIGDQEELGEESMR